MEDLSGGTEPLPIPLFNTLDPSIPPRPSPTSQTSSWRQTARQLPRPRWRPSVHTAYPTCRQRRTLGASAAEGGWCVREPVCLLPLPAALPAACCRPACCMVGRRAGPVQRTGAQDDAGRNAAALEFAQTLWLSFQLSGRGWGGCCTGMDNSGGCCTGHAWTAEEAALRRAAVLWLRRRRCRRSSRSRMMMCTQATPLPPHQREAAGACRWTQQFGS